MVVGVDRGQTSGASLSVEFEEFVLRASPSLLRTAFLLTGDRGHAEDLLQSTLLRTAGRWDAIRMSPDGYARKVLVNLSRDRRRDLSRRPLEVSQSDPVGGVAIDEVDRLLERHAMTQAVCRLPRRQREVVVLRFFLDLSVAETAAAVGASEGTVKSYTARALARMRELLTDDHETAASSEVRHAD